MRKLVWATDIHLNFCHKNKIESFCEKVNHTKADVFVVTGDISEGDKIKAHLQFLEQHLEMPMLFVLGNHDFYNSSINSVRSLIKNEFCMWNEHNIEFGSTGCSWLGGCDFVSLTDKHAIVGHDGWYDGQYSSWWKSKIILADYHVIADLRVLPSELLYQKINDLAQESADHIKRVLPLAFKDHEHVYLATHVPPFPENSKYQGKVSDDQWLPLFSSKRMGDAILDVMPHYPNKRLTVLCGHSHGDALFHPLKNVESYTGLARYRKPIIGKVFEL